MYEQELQILQGTVSAVVFQNYENGYTVLRLSCGKETVTVVGTIPLPVVGEQLMVTGKWSNHSSYGRQFEAEFLERLLPQNKQDILKYLSGRAIKGIGPITAARIVAKFGDDTLQVMEQQPERLAEVTGISLAKAQAIGEAFRLQTGMRQLMEFFAMHNLSGELAVKTYKLYGNQAVELLYDDPYLLMDEELEAPFAAVDRFAIELGVDGCDPRRVEAGILFELRYNLSGGHSFLPEEKLIPATAALLSVDEQVIREGVSRLIGVQRLIRETLNQLTVLYLPKLYEAEVYSCMRLKAHENRKITPPAGLERKLKKAASQSGLEYSPDQEQALRQAAEKGLLLITGGPGTGKTTILKGIISLFEQMDMDVTLCAPTGRAAKRLTEVTGQEASTIHRLLGAAIDPHTGRLFFSKDECDPIKTDVVIVDEMSMVDVCLLSSLLHAITPSTRLIFVGDPDQLPPVGPGSPFSDMLRSGALSAVRLTHIFRQAQESLIVMNAHRVNNGQIPELRNNKSDFFFLPEQSEEHLAKTVVDLCSRRLPVNMGIPADQIQVISPTKKGFAGTVNLNMLLQQQLNPPSEQKQERKYGHSVFREGDRIMQIKNNYDILWKKSDGTVGTGIFNGDVGIIQSIDNDLEQLTILFDDRVAVYDFAQLNELDLAYAMTVHKSQGSEYRAVILALWNAPALLLTRSILYTAITRARELLVGVGRPELTETMTQNARTGRRYTGLKLRLQE